MNLFGITEPDFSPALQRVIVKARARFSRDMLVPEDHLSLPTAVAFVATAIAMAVVLPWERSLDPALALVFIAGYAVASRVEFHVGSGWAVPTQLVFVPMLFAIPIPLVPLCVAAAALLGRLPEYLSREFHPSWVVVRTADDWYSVGPALVLVAAGVSGPEWSDWPIYLAALAAQFVFDLGFSVLRESARLEIDARVFAQEFRTVWLVDLALSPIGLLAAFAATGWEWAFLLALPLIGLIHAFAREREARIKNALTLSSAYRGTAHLLGELLSSSHEYTGAHSRSVVVLAHQVGEAMELDERTMREIEFGALLHDVGKMSVPNEIINKPGKLTEEEWAVMRQHTVEGHEMLDQIGGVLAEVGAVVRSHHERFDGAGYPDGLAGAQIPLAARVITACDSFNAMTTDRPYRSAMSLSDAIAELRANAGTQFDPAVVEAVISVVEEWIENEESRAVEPAERPRELTPAA